MLEVAARDKLITKVTDGSAHPRFLATIPKRQYHQCRRSRDRLCHPTENHAVAVIHSAFVERAIEKQLSALLHPGVVPLPECIESQACPSGWFDPRKRSFRP